MKNIVNSETHGKIEYEESFWTGKKKLSINDVPLQKVNKKTFVTESGEQLIIEGNYLKGSSVQIGSEKIQLTPAVKWYEVVLSVLPFILIMVWGNSLTLCLIVPVVGGAIGGAISAIFSFLNLFIIKDIKPIWLKILISIAMLGATFAICFLIGLAFLSALTLA